MKRLVYAALAAALAAPAGATPWTDFGPRAMGMGGAYTALAQGPEASYYNPAGLGQLYDTSGLAIPVGARGEFTGTVIQGAKDLKDLNDACPGGAACNQTNIDNALHDLNNPGNGAMVDVGGGVDLKIKRAVFFVNDIANIGVNPLVDMTHDTPATLSANQSKLIVRGANFTELGIGYAHEIMESGLVVGANLKGIVGKTAYKQIQANTDSNNFSISSNTRTSFAPAVDVGLLWDMRETFPSLPMRPRFGLVARNINQPKFKNPDAAVLAGERSKYPLDGQVRAGLAISPFKFWNVAWDMDVTDNRTPVDGFKSRYMSLGTEVNIFNRPWLDIPLRAGLQKNLADTGSGLTYTGGFGLNFVHITLDVAGMVSAKETTIESQNKTDKVPNNFGASARFAFLFGGTDEGGRASRHSRK